MLAFIEPPPVNPQVVRQRSYDLLCSLLDKAQRKDLDENGYFTFTSELGNRYTVCHGYSGNVISLGSMNRRYCCYVDARDLPTYDHMAAQFLALKYNEEHFLAIAL
jgi:hypothetical protein